MDHTAHRRLRQDELIESVLAGAVIYDPDDEAVGTVERLQTAGDKSTVVIVTGGHTEGGEATLQIALRDLTFMRDQADSVHAVTHWSRNELLQGRQRG